MKLSGYLLWTEHPSLRSALSEMRRLEREKEDVEGWRQYDYVVMEHIPRVQVQGEPPFKHDLYARAGSDRLIVLSHHHEICNFFIESDLRPVLKGMLRRAEIAIDELVLAIMQVRRAADGTVEAAPDDASIAGDAWEMFRESYSIGHAAAQTDAFHGDLNTVIFEGNNVSSTSLFSDAVPVVRFYRCGLLGRMADGSGFTSTSGMLKISRRGFVSFDVPVDIGGRRNRFREVELVLRTLNRFGFIKGQSPQ